ncbi:MAG: phosphopyruvate hydratase [Sulfolobales archaeon]|nr:phosphopyruvate hydratase [Sulfolobales archaeon]MDW8083482.1 phosphopyruvate hydratase [Sulfolobales archaeon]
MSEFIVEYVRALQVLDSRGDPTVEVNVATRGGGFGRGIAPAGASRGLREAIEIRDGGREYLGRGVERAVESVNKYIAPAIVGMSSYRFRDIDRKLVEIDGTQNKSKLGSNAITATSLAVVNAAADTAGVPLFEFLGGRWARSLPVPLLNIINGGTHAGNELSFQEFMIAPVASSTFSEAIRVAVEVYKTLKEYLKKAYGPASINVGDEGGFAPPMREVREALKAITKAVENAGYRVGEDIFLALDVAASQIYRDGFYLVDGKKISSEDLLKLYIDLVGEFPIISIEDPFAEDQPDYFRELRSELRGRALVIGDDLTVTNAEIISKYFVEGAIDGAIIKINQVGTLTEAERAIEVLKGLRGRAIVSHRSGETEDVSIAHIAVAYGTGLIKTGAPARGERTSKYNELIRIENYLSGDAVYTGRKAFT